MIQNVIIQHRQYLSIFYTLHNKIISLSSLTNSFLFLKKKKVFVYLLEK